MGTRFRHAALVGKYQAQGIRPVLEEIAQFLEKLGLEVSLERETADAMGVSGYEAMSAKEIGQRCDIAVVVGGDGTMLGFARELSQYDTPLVGINQGRLGFITDMPILHPSIAGWVLVPIASHTLSNRPIVLPDSSEIRIEIVAGRDASANFDMQSLTSLLHGDQVRVRRSAHRVRFLHPRGWSYHATLRRKLRWYEGVV